MGTIIDQIGAKVVLKGIPKRIISLVPSQTELLIHLGLKDLLVGRTKFCIHPKEDVVNIPIVGGTKNIDLKRIHKLEPDLIIGNKEENEINSISQLKEYYPVWMSDIVSLNDATEMILSLGGIFNVDDTANKMVKEIKLGFNKMNSNSKNSRVCYVIWKNPTLVVGGQTFINSILTHLGWVNVFEKVSRYPETTLAEIIDQKPDFVLLSSEPFPFKGKIVEAYKQQLSPIRVLCVDGEMFSWYGSRLLKSIKYLKNLNNSLE